MKNYRSYLLSLAKNASFRYEKKSYLIEGSELIFEFVKNKSTSHIKTICMSDEFLSKKLPYLPTERKEVLKNFVSSFPDKIVSTSMKEYQINKITDSVSEGIVAEIDMIGSQKPMNNIVLLDGIRNPGNMGTLLRSALFFNWDTIIISAESSTDPYNIACIRAARNAQAYLRIERVSAEILNEIFTLERSIFLAMPSQSQGINLDSHKEVAKISSKVLVLGSESHGISNLILDLCNSKSNTYKVNIVNSTPSLMESLNVAVAGSILMFQLLNNKSTFLVSKEI